MDNVWGQSWMFRYFKYTFDLIVNFIAFWLYFSAKRLEVLLINMLVYVSFQHVVVMFKRSMRKGEIIKWLH